MLQELAPGVFVHVSELLESNTVVIQGRDGVLVVDPGIVRDELACLASDLRELGQPVVAGFATHPHWDHVLWHAELGDAPRYATAGAVEMIRSFLANADWRELIVEDLPPDQAPEIPLELFGELTALPEGVTRVPWDGPEVRIIEHRAHAQGHAALLLEEHGILVAGDMLSDILMPFLDLQAADPLEDYLASLDRFGELPEQTVVIPGHGSVGAPGQISARIAVDRAYVHSLRDGLETADPRLAPGAPLEWLPEVHAWQARQISERA